MTIKIGDRLPDATFQTMTADGPKSVTTAEVFGGRKIALLAVPGAFTPTCSARHLPGFVDHADAFKAKGVDAIVCLSVNDAFVMDAWGRQQGAGAAIEMLADGGGVFSKAIGTAFDTGVFGGLRSRRYSMLVDDGIVRVVNLEEGGAFEVSNAETLLAAL